MRGFITDRTARAGLRLADDLPEPRPGAGEFLLDVRAYAVNPGETKLIEERPDNWRPGQDVAGVVLAPAADGSGPQAGARVVARVDWEGWAERVAVPVHRSAVLDERVGLEQAATLPIAGLTALRALRTGGAVLGRRVLVTGATGGVGQFAVQLARLSGARVTAHVSGDERAAQARELGAHEVVTCLRDPALGPYHLILDGVAGPLLTDAVHLLAPEGTAVVYGGHNGPTELRLRDFAMRGHNARVQGFISEHPEETKGEDLAILVSLVADGRLRPVLGRVDDWSRTPDVFEAWSKREFRGKAVLLRA
ncbi:zinc-binding dehydrogenase [Streptomyces sp. NPDC048419]|uniref:zinc-binding dehydrogenase n=1 Tax=Streptomyces sp. NPDC048419 TaxID=3365547 RepID=UPI003715963A